MKNPNLRTLIKYNFKPINGLFVKFPFCVQAEEGSNSGLIVKG